MNPATAAAQAALSDRGEEMFDLFRRPQGRSRPRPDERAVIESARISKLTVDGKEAVVYRWGDGARPVLLVHGWESRASRYAKAIARLIDLGYSPVAFDAPGHGESTGEGTTILEYRDILVELHREHGDFEAIVAHSFGVTATFFALQHGVRTGRIVAISPVPDFAYLVESFCTAAGLSEQLDEELRGRIERVVYPGEKDMWTRFSVFHETADLAVPLLVIHDDDDRSVDPGQGVRMAEFFRARLVRTRRFGHQRILGAPQVVEEIVQFVTSGATEPGRKTEVVAG
ncbi:alpha/beta fold hydrolase [Streptomyces sp. NPDC059002]|uniref:alpha/beta fold hydrolase n=1 Tax=Streptomyces sp. NPDC059002 TaxID=3346690 RepID=UPI00369D2FE2